MHKDILHMGLWNGIEIHIPEYSGKSPEILIFKPARTASFVNADRKFVIGVANIICDIKLGRCKTVLRISDKLSVYPQVKSILHALK